MSDTGAAIFEKLDEDIQGRSIKAKALGGPAKLTACRAAAILKVKAYERVNQLVHAGSSAEFGLSAQSARAEGCEWTPGDGELSDNVHVDVRPVAMVANDFAVMGAFSATTTGRDIGHSKEVATRRGSAMIFPGESTGPRMPDVEGAHCICAGDKPRLYRRIHATPCISGALRHCYGSSLWHAAMSDFVVTRKGTTIAINSVKLPSMAISERMNPEDLGGWRVLAEMSGMVEVAVDNDEGAMVLIRRLGSYLPSRHRLALLRLTRNQKLLPRFCRSDRRRGRRQRAPHAVAWPAGY